MRGAGRAASQMLERTEQAGSSGFRSHPLIDCYHAGIPTGLFGRGLLGLAAAAERHGLERAVSSTGRAGRASRRSRSALPIRMPASAAAAESSRAWISRT